jgi:hypothetical protein
MNFAVSKEKTLTSKVLSVLLLLGTRAIAVNTLCTMFSSLVRRRKKERKGSEKLKF